MRTIHAGALLLVLAAPAAAQAPEPKPTPYPVTTSLYAGRLLTVDQDQAGHLSRGSDLWALRLIVSAKGPAGFRVGFRGDLTSLSYIDPSNLNLAALRSAEGYGALSWSAGLKSGVSFGPALMAGALVPVENRVDWRLAKAYGGGLRVGYGRSWAYMLAAKDEAADLACACSGGARGILVGSLEVWRLSLQGEWVSKAGGRKRLGAMVRVPLPQ